MRPTRGFVGHVSRRRRGYPGRVPADGARHDPRARAPERRRPRPARANPDDASKQRRASFRVRGSVHQQQLRVQLPRTRRSRRRAGALRVHRPVAGRRGPARVETVTETKRSYKDSNGRERHGVSRTVGDRGRRVTRERDGVSGEERCEDRLLATEDGDAFDRDWAAAAAASQLHDERRFLYPRTRSGLMSSAARTIPQEDVLPASREPPRRAPTGQAARRVRREGDPRRAHPKTRGGSQTHGETTMRAERRDEPLR